MSLTVEKVNNNVLMTSTVAQPHNVVSEEALFKSKPEDNIDIVELSSQNEISDEEKAKKKAKTKKILIGVGIGLAIVATVAFAIYTRKKQSLDLTNSLASGLSSEASTISETADKVVAVNEDLQSLTGLSGCIKFGNMSMIREAEIAKELSSEETVKLFMDLDHGGNMKLFMATATGAKPGCIIDSSEPIHMIEKLRYSEPMDFVHIAPTAENGIINNLTYMFNRDKVCSIIEKNKEIFTCRLGLSPDSTISEIYSSLLEMLKNAEKSGYNVIKSDLEGLCLGFPKYDTLIFNMEKTMGFDPKLRENTPKLIEKLLDLLKSPDSPYKSLSKKELRALKEAIKNISGENLRQINIRGSYNDGLYGFINYINDKAELERVASSTREFISKFKLADYLFSYS